MRSQRGIDIIPQADYTALTEDTVHASYEALMDELERAMAKQVQG